MKKATPAKQFRIDSARISPDRKHFDTILFNMTRYEQAVGRGLSRYRDMELARERVIRIKNQVLERWDEYLVLFEENMKKRGVEVLWAETDQQAVEFCLAILKHHGVKQVVKSKSMLSEELDLNDWLSREGIEPVETDLGEFIVQLAGEKPYHIVTPAMHKSKEQVAQLFHEKFGLPADASPEAITLYVRALLRKKYQEAGAGITGANFLVADPGLVALTENEGNGLLSTSFPKVHVVMAGIEKLIPDIRHLSYLWPVLAVRGTGQQLTVYNSLFRGPKTSSERNGPEKMYVILLDNGRSALFGKDDHYSALRCIRCGACLNACPVYRTIGGYTYNTTYSGPIGSVITPHLKGMKDYGHLSFASSLCGRCNEVCPAGIDLHRLLLLNRRDYVNAGYSAPGESVLFKGFALAASHRALFDAGGPAARNLVVRMIRKKYLWGKTRQLPRFRKSFASQWKANQSNQE